MTTIPELKAAALAATLGPWDFDNRETPFQIQGGEVCGGDALPWGDVYTMYEVETVDADGDACSEPQIIAEMVSIENGRFIRAANPATILALIERLQVAEDAAKRAAMESMEPVVLKDAPKHIYLVIEDADGDLPFATFRDAESAARADVGLMWCQDRQGPSDIPYVRADLVASLSTDAKDAENFRSIIKAIASEISEPGKPDGNAPGHCHDIPGVWDSDNGAKAGKECAWCKTWSLALAAIAAKEPTP